MMKRIYVAIAVVVVAAAGYAVTSRIRSSSNPPVESVAAIPAVKAGQQVVAEARVVPIRGATLSLPAGGTVVEVLVAEGASVQAGQVLVRLDTARQATAALAGAEASLQRAQARLNELRAGTRTEDVEAARAALQAAEARHRQVRAGAREQERAQAASQVQQAGSQVAAARQRVAQAETALRLAEDDLRRAEQLQRLEAVAQQFVEQARARVQTARAELEAARAQQAVAGAQLAAARQQQSLVQAGARPEEIQAAEAEVRRARAQLDLLLAGPRPQTLAAAEADVAVAAASLKQARAALAQAELRAPFGGTIAWLGPKVGEFAAPGAPVVRLGDLTTWQIETTDLTELSVTNIRPGDRVKITIDGIPGLELTGRVASINAFGENRQGDITYTVLITLARQDSRLRWNMTASVAIEPANQGSTP